MSNIIQHIFVRKDVKLETGESLSDFTDAAQTSARSWLKQQLNLGTRDYIYTVEIFSKSMILNVSSYDTNDKRKEAYYAISYTRKEDGNFEFGSMLEVERVVSFQAKQSGISKAKMSNASINDLPDAAFAIIKPGGKKDANGKTVPRSLRMLPHHNSTVKDPNDNKSIDLPHLRNALARVSQASLTPEQMARAKAHLNKHAKAVLPSYGGKNNVSKSLTDCEGWKLISKSLWNNIL